MQPVINHPWNITEQEARDLQQTLAVKVEKEDRFNQIQFIAGTDVAYAKESGTLVAGVTVLRADTLEVVEHITTSGKAQFPYIPGLFSFRELPALAKALERLTITPDLVVCDGQGYAHPRRFGLACHLGVTFDVPTIGCGKSVLTGKYQELDIQRGAISPLIEGKEIIGNALRSQTNINPIFVSVGHRISLASATGIILNLCVKHKLPETTRFADQLVKAALSGIEPNFQ